MVRHPYNEPAYGRQTLINIIEDYYKFLARMYIPDDLVKYPPDSNGWPNITAESTANLDKSEHIKSLIKHLPYISEVPQVGRNVVNSIHYNSFVVDYSPRGPDELNEDLLEAGESSLRHDVEEENRRRPEESDDDDDNDDEDGSEEVSSDEGLDNRNEQANGSTNQFGAEFFGNDFCVGDTDLALIDMRNVILLSQGFGSYGRSLVLDLLNGYIRA